MTRTAIVIASLAAALLSGSIAHAAPDSEATQVKVSYADLNLATPDGVAALHNRIDAAAKGACSELSTDSSLDGVMQYRGCVKAYVAKLSGAITLPTQAQVASNTDANAH